MIPKELIDINVRYNSYVTEGIGNGTMMPHLLMDIVLQEFTNEIAKLPIGYSKAAKYRKEWRKEYQTFNERFFEPYTNEQTIAITDAMDEMEEFVEEDVAGLKNAIRERMGHVRASEREALVSCILSHMLVSAAQLFWEINCRKGPAPSRNVHLDRIIVAILRFMDEYYTGTESVLLSTSEEIKGYTNTLCRKMVRWSVGKE